MQTSPSSSRLWCVSSAVICLTIFIREGDESETQAGEDTYSLTHTQREHAVAVCLNCNPNSCQLETQCFLFSDPQLKRCLLSLHTVLLAFTAVLLLTSAECECAGQHVYSVCAKGGGEKKRVCVYGKREICVDFVCLWGKCVLKEMLVSGMPVSGVCVYTVCRLTQTAAGCCSV